MRGRTYRVEMDRRPPYLVGLVPLVAACSLINSFSIGDGGADAGVDGFVPEGGAVDSAVDAPTAPSDGGACASACLEPTPLCDPSTSRCVSCLAATDCDDDDFCTIDRCSLAGSCENVIEPLCVSRIEGGGGHTCAVRRAGNVLCWGANTVGQLGDSTTTQRSRPQTLLDLLDVVAVSAGSYQTCAVQASGRVACWGALFDGADPPPTSSVPVEMSGITDGAEVAAGLFHTCALRRGGRVMCWGAGTAGQLGNGEMVSSAVPVEVLDLADATQLSTGGWHSCARSASGAVFCWGDNGEDQLGIGDGTIRTVARPTAVVDLADATNVSAGTRFTCASRRNGEVACWGHNPSGQLGDGSRANSVRPIRVVGVSDAVEVHAGAEHACARTGGGQVVCWGDNMQGQLGDGTTEDRLTMVPTGVTDAISLTVGGAHGCVRQLGGTVVCWGANGGGQLGDGTMMDRFMPVAVVDL